jgi:hypothetical protein
MVVNIYLIFLRKSGAGDGIRTHDPNLDKGEVYAASLGIWLSTNRKNRWLRGHDLNVRPSGYEPDLEQC